MKISTKINSHIVPETYLKHFTDASDRLWKYKINSEFPSKIKQASPSQVCYKPNYFRIENENILASLAIKDKDYIEKEAFKKYENNYNKILAKITSRSKCILSSEAQLLIDTLINIKARNYAIRKYYCKENVTPIYEEFLKELEKGWSHTEPVIKIGFKKIKEMIKENIIDKEGVEDDMFLTSLAKKDKEGAMAEVENSLLKLKWVFLIADKDSAFITSDNPGFCVDDKEIVRNIKFSGNYLFFFPLAPRICLRICNLISDKYDILNKQLNFELVSAVETERINYGTKTICNEELFANTNEALIPFLNNKSFTNKQRIALENKLK